MPIMKNSAFIIAGPTASGKSDFAHVLAQKTGGVIINCDSVQVYRGIENIAASPFAGRDIADMINGVPYRLFSVLDLSAQISVAEYLAMARREYIAARDAGRVAIFVGGTGYYIHAILNGISPIPDVSPAVRCRAREMVAADIAAARAMLPADFGFSDPQRIARALEVFLQTGHHLVEYQRAPRSGAIDMCAKTIIINPPADVLRARIAARIPDMINGGALAEAENIIKNSIGENRAIGAEQLCRYLRGEISYDECCENWINKTNQYAKRQRTWFRTQIAPDVVISHVPDADDIDMVLD